MTNNFIEYKKELLFPSQAVLNKYHSYLLFGHVTIKRTFICWPNASSRNLSTDSVCTETYMTFDIYGSYLMQSV